MLCTSGGATCDPPRPLPSPPSHHSPSSEDLCISFLPPPSLQHLAVTKADGTRSGDLLELQLGHAHALTSLTLCLHYTALNLIEPHTADPGHSQQQLLGGRGEGREGLSPLGGAGCKQPAPHSPRLSASPLQRQPAVQRHGGGGSSGQAHTLASPTHRQPPQPQLPRHSVTICTLASLAEDPAVAPPPPPSPPHPQAAHHRLGSSAPPSSPAPTSGQPPPPPPLLAHLSLDASYALCFHDLAAAMARMPLLYRLDLRNGVGTEDDELATLASLPSLRHLSLSGCRAITDAGLACLTALSRLTGLGVWGMRGVQPCALAAYVQVRRGQGGSPTCRPGGL